MILVLCLCGDFLRDWEPQRHREHRGAQSNATVHGNHLLLTFEESCSDVDCSSYEQADTDPVTDDHSGD